MASVRHLLLLLITLLATPASLSSQSVIQMPRKRHRPAASDDSLYCDSWRFSIETNDAETWSNIPSRCVRFVQDYMNDDQYPSDLESVANYSMSFAKGVTMDGDGKDAWVFDIDERRCEEGHESNYVSLTSHFSGCRAGNPPRAWPSGSPTLEAYPPALEPFPLACPPSNVHGWTCSKGKKSDALRKRKLSSTPRKGIKHN